MPTDLAGVVGFTGTRDEPTDAQRLALGMFLRVLFGGGCRTIHHGCCVGADTVAALLSRESGYRVIGHPGHIPSLTSQVAIEASHDVHPAKDNMVRNGDIVTACSVLVVCPKAPEAAAESRRSGTWATCRMARRGGKRIGIVWPDGTLTTEGNW